MCARSQDQHVGQSARWRGCARSLSAAGHHGRRVNTLAGWRWRLSSKGQATLSPAAAEAERAQETVREDLAPMRERKGRRVRPVPAPEPVAPMKFVELTTELPVPTASATFEVLLLSGVTVRVPGGFDAGELARLVGALEGVRA